VQACIARGLAYAPYADVLWWETSHPNMAEARLFAETVLKQFPNKFLAYNCSPSFNWRANLDSADIAAFQRELGAMGYKYQFVTLAGFHALNYGMFELARGYRDHGMAAYSELQQAEFAAEAYGYTAVRHQHEVGTGYFDAVALALSGGTSSTTALKDSTEAEQFAARIHERYPGRLLAYNCSPSFNWRGHLSDSEIAGFQRDLAAMGYRFQFITLAGFHALNLSMFELARGYRADAMPAYVEVQEREFALEEAGYTATRHQREVGAGYFDQVMQAVSGGESSTLALTGSTEEQQFHAERSAA
jgi:isocitrate lyase